MKSKTLTVYLSISVLLVFSITLFSYSTKVKLPGDNTGYEPVQPINYSHRLHAGELQINCQFCHTAANKGKHAAVPSASVCMGCHKNVTAPFLDVKQEEESANTEKRPPQLIVSKELKKLYDATGFNPDSNKYDKKGKPIVWEKIYTLADFVYFNHSAHVNSGVECQNCHGAVETMERVRQVTNFTMGYCVNCHRDKNLNGVNGKKVHAPIDCSGCHY